MNCTDTHTCENCTEDNRCERCATDKRWCDDWKWAIAHPDTDEN